MSPSSRPFVRTTAGRLAVAGVAALASVSAVAPAAFADDTDLAPESTEQTPEPPAPSVETSPAPEVDTPTETDPDASGQPAAPAPETESENGTSKTSEGTVTARAEVVEDVVEYGPQTIAVTFSRIPDAFYGDYYGETITPQAVVNIFRDEEFVRTVVCTSELSPTESAPGTADCLFDESPTIDLQPGERAEVYSAFGGAPTQTVQPCQVGECSSTPVELDFVVPAPSPMVSAYYSPRVFQGVPVSQDLLAVDSVEDPTTTVRIVSGPEHGTATLGADGRTLTYTSDEDFSGTEVIRYEATNRNGTETGSWEIRVFDPMVPDFGSQKYRVGVQVASGAFVPAGTTTVGSTFEIVTTSQTGETTTRTCTTVPAPSGGNDDGASVCAANDIFDYIIGTSLPAGSRAVITQTGVPEGQSLLPDPDPIVIEPCDLNVTDPCSDRTAQFETPGSILPLTQPDTATAVQGGEPIVIDVLANDTSEDPDTGLEVTPLAPGQGTIEVIGAAAPPVEETPGGVGILAVPSAGSLALRYTPPANFSGEVPVEYAVTNSNGSTSGTLTITVQPAAELPVDPETPTLPADPEGPVTPPTVDTAPAAVEDSATAPARVDAGSSMPNTGGPASSLLSIGFVLAAAGAGILGRRRSTVTRGR